MLEAMNRHNLQSGLTGSKIYFEDPTSSVKKVVGFGVWGLGEEGLAGLAHKIKGEVDNFVEFIKQLAASCEKETQKA